MESPSNCVRQQENQPLRSDAVVYGPTRSDFRTKWLKPLSIVMKNFGKKNRVDVSKIFDFAPISSKQMICPRTVALIEKRKLFLNIKNLTPLSSI